MLMEEIALASINRFGNIPKADFVPPSEQLITLTIGQLQDLIKEAIQPLQDRVEALEVTVASLQEDNAALRRSLASLEARQDQDTTRICLDIAYDRQRISKLEQGSPQHQAAPTEPRGNLTAARIDLLKDTCKAHGGGITFKEAGRLLGMKPNQMTAFVAQLDKRSFEVFTRSGDRRQKVIRLKTRINDC
jgi:hypothetical protein